MCVCICYAASLGIPYLPREVPKSGEKREFNGMQCRLLLLQQCVCRQAAGCMGCSCSDIDAVVPNQGFRYKLTEEKTQISSYLPDTGRACSGQLVPSACTRSRALGERKKKSL